MSGYAGALPHVVLSRTLWLLLAPLLLGFLWHATVPYRANPRSPHGATAPSPRPVAGARIVGFASLTLAAGAAVAHLVALHRELTRPALFLEFMTRGVRIGRLDAPIVLSFDGFSAVACVLACGVALIAAAFIARRPRDAAEWREWAWLELALAGALLSFLADGLVALSLGWALAGAAGAWLAGWADAKAGVHAATRTAVALAALLLGASLLFWGLGGTWNGDDYAGETRAGFAIVRTNGQDEAPPEAAETESVGESLTFASQPGTAVLLDDAPAPAMTAPFVDAPLPRGPHTLGLLSAPLANDGRVEVALPNGARSQLVLLGPTLSLREAGALALVRDPAGETAIAHELRGRAAPAEIHLVSAVLALWILAAWAMSGASLRAGAPSPLIAVAYGVTTALLGPFLLARASFLLIMAPRVRVLIASVGAAILVTGFGRGLGKGASSRPFQWTSLLSALPGGIAWMAVGMVGGEGMTMASRGIVCGGLAGATLLLFMARRGSASPDSADVDSTRGPTMTGIVLEQVPDRLGLLLLSYERWVIDATGRAVLALIRVAAWALTLTDGHILGAPGDAAASRFVRAGHRLSPIVGGSLARIAWAGLAFLATVGLGLTLWFRR